MMLVCEIQKDEMEAKVTVHEIVVAKEIASILLLLKIAALKKAVSVSLYHWIVSKKHVSLIIGKYDC